VSTFCCVAGAGVIGLGVAPRVANRAAESAARDAKRATCDLKPAVAAKGRGNRESAEPARCDTAGSAESRCRNERKTAGSPERGTDTEPAEASGRDRGTSSCAESSRRDAA
jgi:hypothetical protein